MPRLNPRITLVVALVVTSTYAVDAAAKCSGSNVCLCAAENPSHAALRVLPSSVSPGFVNISAVVRPGDCSYSVGDSIDLSSEVEDDEAFAAYPELLVGVDCNSNLRSFVVLDDESATCPDADFSISRDDALTLNASEECASEVNDVAPNPPCEDVNEGCCATTAPRSTPVWMLLAFGLLLVRRRQQ